MSATERLLDAIGRPAVNAVRDLDAGEDPEIVWLRYLETQISPALAQTLMLARRLGGTITSQELCRQFPMSASTASNRLARLGELGLLVEAGEERIPGGGRRFLWQAWDACRIAPEAVSSGEVSSSSTMSFPWPDTTKRVIGIQFSAEGLRYIYEDDSNTEAL